MDAMDWKNKRKRWQRYGKISIIVLPLFINIIFAMFAPCGDTHTFEWYNFLAALINGYYSKYIISLSTITMSDNSVIA